MADFLVNNGANVRIGINNTPQDGNNVSVLRFPIEHRRWDLVERLIRQGANPREYYNKVSPLGYFVQSNNQEVIRFIIGNANQNGQDVINYPSHHSPLKIAVIMGNLEVVRLLVESGASVGNRETLDGNGNQAQYKFTPIQFAAMFGHKAIVRHLISLPTHQTDYADINIGFSLDLLDERTGYSASIDMNELASNMLPYNREGFNYNNDEDGQRNLRADLLMLQAGSKHYALQRAVPRVTGNPNQIQQRRGEYLNRALLALDVLQRANLDPPLITTDGRFDRITVLQKMAFSWFCTSITTYARDNRAIQNSNPAWKSLSYMGCIIDHAANRGYFHGHRLIRNGIGTIFDQFWEDILPECTLLENFISNDNEETRNQFKNTNLYKIASYLNDCEQLSKVDKLYLFIDEEDLLSNDGKRIEAVLNAIAATLEIITEHLSEVSRNYFHDLNLNTLQQIRNHLRHVNGDNHTHNVFSEISRAKRFENLMVGQNPKLMQALRRFIRNDFAEIRIRVNQYQSFIEGINTKTALYRSFRRTDGQMEYIRNTLWSYSHFFAYRRNATELYNLLNEAGHVNYQQEAIIQKYLRTNTDINTVTYTDNHQYENGLRAWNARVRTELGLNREHMRSLPAPEKARIAELLPNRDNRNNNVELSKKIHCYLRHAGNIHYAIATLQRIIQIQGDIDRLNDQLMQESFNRIAPSLNTAGHHSPFYSDPAHAEIKKNNLIKHSAIEWHAVHFYEHVAELIREPIFKESYHEKGGDTSQLMIFSVEQIRNYIAHVTNLSFVDGRGIGEDSSNLSKLVEQAQPILSTFEQIQEDWQGLLNNLVRMVPQARQQEIEARMQRPTTLAANTNETNSPTSRQLLTGIGFFAAAGLAVGAAYYFAENNSFSKNSPN